MISLEEILVNRIRELSDQISSLQKELDDLTQRALTINLLKHVNNRLNHYEESELQCYGINSELAILYDQLKNTKISYEALLDFQAKYSSAEIEKLESIWLAEINTLKEQEYDYSTGRVGSSHGDY